MTLESLKRVFRRDFWLTVGPAVALVVAAFAIAYHFVQPAPPKRIVMATGDGEGGYRHYFRKYRALLEKDGITLDQRPSGGAMENLKLLANPDSGVDVGFVQGGTNLGSEEARGLVSLGSLYYEPLWVFYRGEPIEDLVGLRGKRIGVGAADGGTYALAKQLLDANGIGAAPTELLFLPRKEASQKLVAGEIDALFLVSPAESPVVRRLATSPGVRLLSFARADAYTRKFPFLNKLTLPRGVLDLAADVPSADVVLLSPTALLVAKETLHPAVAYLLLRAASQIHDSPGLLDRAGEFPSPSGGDFPLSEDAKQYYKSGLPLLQRVLPFWAAVLAQRLWVMLLPLIAVLLPLFRVLPSLYSWRVRSRIYRWYARLKEIELELEEKPGQIELQVILEKLDALDQAINHIPTPLSYSEKLYSFRQHIELVRARVVAALKGREAPKDPESAAAAQ